MCSSTFVVGIVIVAVVMAMNLVVMIISIIRRVRSHINTISHDVVGIIILMLLV